MEPRVRTDAGWTPDGSLRPNGPRQENPTQFLTSESSGRRRIQIAIYKPENRDFGTPGVIEKSAVSLRR